jgi:hypothetical protein
MQLDRINSEVNDSLDAYSVSASGLLSLKDFWTSFRGNRGKVVDCFNATLLAGVVAMLAALFKFQGTYL